MPKGTSSKLLNTLPLVALALVFGWAAWERLRLPLVPCVGNDDWQYLGPRLDALLGEQFREWSGKCFLYPWFLYALLRVGSSFWWIALVQGLLSLGTGGLLLGCWMELRRHLSAPRLPSFTFKLLGVLLVAVYLFSTATVEFGRRLRPETVFPFIVSLQIYCNLRFIRARFLQHQPGCNLLSGAAAVFFSVAASLLEPSFSGAVLLANVPVIISLFRDGQSLRCKVLLVAVSASATVLLLIYPEWMLLRRDSDRSVFLMQSPFTIHADLINAHVTADINSSTHCCPILPRSGWRSRLFYLVPAAGVASIRRARAMRY